MQSAAFNPGRAASSTQTLVARIYRYKVLLRRRWWVLVLTTSVVMCLQALFIERQPRTFSSHAQMVMSGKVRVTEGTGYTEELQNFFGTQISLLRSDLILNRAAARVKTLRPDLPPVPVEVIAGQQRGADIIDLRATGSEAEYTRAYLDAVMEEYLEYKKEKRIETTDSSLQTIMDLLLQRDKELKDALEKLHDFKRKNAIDLLEQQNRSASSYLAKLNSQLADLKMEYELLNVLTPDQQLELGARTGTPGGEPPGETVVTSYQRAREQIQKLVNEREEWSEFLKPAHPRILKLDGEIERMQKQLAFYKEQTLEELRLRKLKLEQEIKAASDTIKEVRAEVDQGSSKLADYEQLKGDVARAQNFYEEVQRLSRTFNLSRDLGRENVSILKPASVAVIAARDLKKSLLLAGVAGLVLGVGLLYVLDRFDDRITTLSELAEQLNEVLVGQVPEVKMRKTKGRLELLKPDDDRHMFAEAYRNIRSSLLFMDAEGHKPKTIIITSAAPNEGKSTVTANLALTMARAGNRVLLVDADLRRGSQHRSFNIEPEPGLVEYLRKEAKFADILRPLPDSTLTIVPRGQFASNAGELLLSSTMDQFLNEAEARYDVVLFDSAPVLATDDTTSFAPKVDGVLFIVRGSFTSARLARAALDQLHHRQVNVLGLVFNRVDTSIPEYHYYKYNEYYSNTGPA
jgi:capsular exopolysaccharide synthesis family protein